MVDSPKSKPITQHLVMGNSYWGASAFCACNSRLWPARSHVALGHRSLRFGLLPLIKAPRQFLRFAGNRDVIVQIS